MDRNGSNLPKDPAHLDGLSASLLSRCSILSHMYTLFPLFALLTAGPLATLAHGVVTSHKIRQYGPSVAERCVSKDGIDHW